MLKLLHAALILYLLVMMGVELVTWKTAFISF